MAKEAWGIDVSKFSLKGVKVRRTGSRLEIVDIDVVEFPVPAGTEPVDTDLQIREGLLSFTVKNKLAGAAVACSLPGHGTFNRVIKLPPVEERRLQEIVRYEAQQHIPFKLDEVIWNYQPIERAYEPGEEREVIIFAVKKDIVGQFLRNATEVKFSLDILQFAPTALFNFVTYDQDISGTTVVLDMGADNTDLTVIDAEKYWIRNLPIAGNDITKAIAKKFQLPFNEAEKLKVTAAQSPQANKIFAVVQPVLRDLVGEIHRSLGHYKSLSKNVKFDKMLIAGNSSKTLNFQKYLSQNLQMDVQKLSKLGKIGLSGRVNEASFQKHLPSIGVCLGLAIQVLGMARNRVNLLPAELLAKKELALKKPYFAGIAAALALSVGALYLNAGKDIGTLRSDNKRLQEISDRMGQIESRINSSKQMHAIDKRQEIVATCAAERDLILKMLNRLNELLPDTSKLGDDKKLEKIWLLEFKAEENETKTEVNLEEITAPTAEAREITKGPKPYITSRKVEVVAEFGIFAEGRTLAEHTSFWKEKIVLPFVSTFGLDSASVKLVAEPAEPILYLRSKKEDADAAQTAGYREIASVEKKYFRLLMTTDPVPVNEEKREAMIAKLKEAAAAQPTTTEEKK
jgi:type IV pilus assembly protein PilM